MFAAANVLDLELLIQAQDMASGVLQGIGGLLDAVVGKTAAFQLNLTQTANNTTMTTAAVQQMRQAVLDLNSQSGAPLDQLTKGFMLAYDTGFNASESTKILDAAMKSAVATGANVSDVTGTLALQMHDFGLGADQAGEAMNVLHLASADSRVTMQQFADETSKATTMAANLGVPMTVVDAALAALTLHLGSASLASTTLAGEFSKLVNPSVSTEKELKTLSEQTGINLVQDFTSAGMQARGFTQVMADLKAATGGNTDEMLRLIPAFRGGLAEMVLLGTGSQDYARILNDLNNAMAGNLDPTTQAYNATLNTFDQSVQIVQADVQQFLMDVGQPIIDTLTPYLHGLIDWMTSHKTEISDFGKAIGTDVGEGVKTLAQDIIAHKTEIEAFVKTLGTDMVQGVEALSKDIPILVGNLDAMAKGFQGVATQLAPVVNLLGEYFSIQGTILHTQLQAAGAIGSTVGGIGGAIGNFLFPPEQSVGGRPPSAGTAAYPYGPAIPASYGLVEQGRFGAGDFMLSTAPYYGPPIPSSYLPAGTAPGASTQPPGSLAGAPGAQTTPSFLTATQLQALLDQAKAQFDLDLRDNANQATLLGDIKAIAYDMQRTGIDGAQLAYTTKNLQDQAFTNLIGRATDQFNLDRLNGAGQTVLLGDIKAITSLMSQQGDAAVKVALEYKTLWNEMMGGTTTTAALSIPRAYLSGGRLPNIDAGYGSAQFAFGTAPTSDSSIIASLQAQVAHLQQVNATLQRQLVAEEETAAGMGELVTIARNNQGPTAGNFTRSRGSGGAF